MASPQIATPESYDEAAAALAQAANEGARVRIRGGGTKLDWGSRVDVPDVELSTAGLRAIVEHNAGDLTAVLQAGAQLRAVQSALAEAGQMLAIDPPLADGDAATVGGVLATGDSGPLRHRHGGPRDLVLGATVALSDGTLARSGGKVIKNVAGYDLAKLLVGSFGTLGAILEVAVRLHPLPRATVTAKGSASDPDEIASAASDLAHAALEAQCLDVEWSDGRGRVLARFAGIEAGAQAAEAIAALACAGLETETVEDDDALWDEQRRRQRSGDGVVMHVSGVQRQLADQMRAADRAGGAMVGRVAHGLSWISFGSTAGAAESIARLRAELAPSPCVFLDAPAAVRAEVDPWGTEDGGAVQLMRRVKQRFDPAGACNAGIFVGGI